MMSGCIPSSTGKNHAAADYQSMTISYTAVRNFTSFALCLIAGSGIVMGQTLIDLRTQSRSVDFSGAGSTKPMRTGPALPSSCGTGELFFLVGATGGRNTFGCTTPNIWTLQSGGSALPDSTGHNSQVLSTDGTTAQWLPLAGDVSGAPGAAIVGGLRGRALAGTQPADGQVLTWSQSGAQWQPQTAAASSGTQASALNVTFGSSTTLNLAVGCSAVAPCNVRFGNTVYAITAASTVTLQSGSGSSYIYLTSAGVLTVGSTLSLACSAGCTVASGIMAFPRNVVPLFIWNANPTGWDPNGGTDLRAPLSAKLISTGLGLTMVDSGVQSTVAIDASSVPGYLSATATLVFPAVAAASCSAELTIGVPGANPGDAVAPGWPATLPANLIGVMRVPLAGTVGVKLCNPTGAAINVPTDVFTTAIIRAL